MTELPEIWPASVAALALFAILILSTLYYWQRARSARRGAQRALERAVAAEASLSSAPAGSFTFTHGSKNGGAGTTRISASLVEALGMFGSEATGFDAVLRRLDTDSAKRLSTAVELLRRDGTAFTLQAQRSDGERFFEVSGRRLRKSSGETRENPSIASDMIWFVDVTASAKALSESKSAHQHLKSLLDALPIPIWYRSEDTTLMACNAAYARALDSNPEAIVDGGLELLGQSKQRQARGLAEKALADSAPVAESHHVVINGARRLLEINERPFGTQNLLGFAIDQTRREELQSELDRHIRAQADVLENLGTAIAIYGSDMKLSFFNSAYARLWDMEEAFFHAKPHFGDVLEALRERRRLPEHPDFPAFKQDTIKTYSTLIEPKEDLVHLPDGSTLRMLAVPHPLGGVLLSYEDVTDRLALETNYNTLIEVQRETIDKLYEGVAVYGADGRLKLHNPAFAKIWKLPPELLATEPHMRQILDATRSFFEVPDEEWADYQETTVGQSTDPSPRDGRREHPDGSVIDWAQVPLPDGAVLFTFLDVTDSIRVERALLDRNEALETADRLKSEFIANISYELRTPLNAIIGFAEILENQFYGDLNERQMEYSRAIVDSSQRLITLINDILDLASIEAGYLHLDLAPTDIHELLESVYTLGRERARNRGIEIKLDCPVGIGILMADARRLKQALFNLLSNALKFTEEGGTVTLSAKHVGSELHFSVTDNGSGISEGDQSRVFGKFERGSGARQAGAGLGLSLVKSLIELHGGWVELDSTVGSGTKVTCHIPLREATHAA